MAQELLPYTKWDHFCYMLRRGWPMQIRCAIASAMKWCGRRVGVDVHFGATRVAFLIGKYAIKMPSVRLGNWDLGRRVNQREAEFSKTGHLRIAPIVWSLPWGLLVVQERVFVPRNFARKYFNPSNEMVKDPDWLATVFAGVNFDAAPCNFGFIGRRLVTFDYGNERIQW